MDVTVPPVERPPHFKGREFLNPTELAQAEQAEREAFARLVREASGPRSVSEIDAAPTHEKGIVGAEYNNFGMANILAAGRADDYSSLETARTEAEAHRRRAGGYEETD